MNSAKAIYIKHFRDVMKNSGVLITFIMFPAMAFLMTNVVDATMPGMSETFFVTMFAGMFVGMAIIAAIAPAIAEDRERNSLRFLLMAGVKSHEYLMGIGGVFLTFSLAGCIAFAIIMPDASLTQMFVMALSMFLGCAASILLGAIIGMVAKNEQEAISISSVAGLVVSFGPFIANITQNDMLLRIFGFLYTMNFADADMRTSDIIQSFGVILANVLVLAFVFAFIYGKKDSANKGGFDMKNINKKTKSAIAAVAVIGGIAMVIFNWHNAGFVATDNAHIGTTMIPISANGNGMLERFSLQEGQTVSTDEVLGWVEGGEAMRSPVDGVVIQTSAVQGQFVSPMETVAVISDINSVHVQANVEETDILNIQVGQRAYVRIDAFGRQRFAGYVTNVGRITLPDDSFGSSRTTLLIPVEIKIIDDVNLDRLIGANASVRIPIR